MTSETKPTQIESMQFLLDAFVGIGADHDEKQILQRALDVACKITGATKGGAIVWEGEEIHTTAELDLSAAEVEGLLAPAEGSRFPRGIHLQTASHPELGAVISTTVDCDGEISGALCLAKPDGEAFTPEDELLIRAVARQAAQAFTTVNLLHQKEREGARRTEARFSSLVKHSSDVTTLIDVNGKIVYQSPSVERILGFSLDELIGSDSMNLVHPDDQAHVAAVMVKAMKESSTAVFEARIRTKDGRWLYSETILNSLLKDPEVQGVVLNTRDISERKHLEEELSHQAFHDSLTDLANRALFKDRVAQALTRSKRAASPIAVLFLDLDNFKRINDSQGHEAGDALLVAVALRLRQSLRDMDTAARLGGDEFAVLLEGIRNEEDAEIVARRVVDSMKTPLQVRGKDLVVHCSAGVAVAAGDVTAEELLRNADVAMYSAKAEGKNRYAMFDPSMHASVVAKIDLEAELRKAIEERQFVVHYQPTVALQSGTISGMEALVRWQHPERGLVPPLDFIPLAEETGLIVTIGRRVLREACRQTHEWHKRYPQEKPLSISVNLSARQLQDPGLVQDVVSVLEETGLDPQYLVLEITESVLMAHTNETMTTLLDLRKLGVRLAIDDFGTGYSSLAYLQRLPVNILKIDRSFVAGLEGGSTEWAMTRAIIELGQSLNLQTVAEGIEDPAQVLHLQSLQCDHYQGFYFAKPLVPDAIEELLQQKQKDAAKIPA
ncbi:MAG TPA: EAL domain-containing protein [Actinomycetota bacterium]|nr:EAL domain-containing protein [Actinomycetota bacterium]